MADEHRSYLLRMEQKLRHKRVQVIKKAMREGREEAIQGCAPFLEQLAIEATILKRKKAQLVADLAQRMIEKKMEKEPESIIAMLAGLLRNVPEHTDVEVSLHPVDANLIKSSFGTINILTDSSRKLVIIEDPNFTRGSIVIKANKSVVDAHIKTQVDRAKELLMMSKEYKKWQG